MIPGGERGKRVNGDHERRSKNKFTEPVLTRRTDAGSTWYRQASAGSRAGSVQRHSALRYGAGSSFSGGGSTVVQRRLAHATRSTMFRMRGRAADKGLGTASLRRGRTGGRRARYHGQSEVVYSVLASVCEGMRRNGLFAATPESGAWSELGRRISSNLVQHTRRIEMSMRSGRNPGLKSRDAKHRVRVLHSSAARSADTLPAQRTSAQRTKRGCKKYGAGGGVLGIGTVTIYGYGRKIRDLLAYGTAYGTVQTRIRVSRTRPREALVVREFSTCCTAPVPYRQLPEGFTGRYGLPYKPVTV
ncbi:hypothetical protein B0H13DRAFT_1908822 [Mycena leptocephala]|nr:hypothetical protein B0H13DRAFT_1908822 [Mycena leptocephala]